MSVELESKTRIANLISAANAKTGGSDTDLTSAVAALIAGFGQGGGESAFPIKLYETDFIVDDATVEAGTNGVLCTISTGLSDDCVVAGNELVLADILCEPTAVPAASWVKRLLQFISPNQGTIQCPVFGFYEHRVQSNEPGSKRSYTAGTGAYLTGATTDLSSLTVSVRFNAVPPAAGNYHLELYRTGWTV